jgi:uncharacterized protein (TIGR02145 family)
MKTYGHVDYQGQRYKTVVIGTQTWMAENLNYNPSTGNSACYENKASNCITYGRLYDWSTAMSLSASCNNSSSCSVQSKHRGICPSGWHIPSHAEWYALETAVSVSTGTTLKALSGWYNNSSGTDGTDGFGFSALPGGIGYSSSSFYNVGGLGYWWSATEYTASIAYSRGMSYSSAFVSTGIDSKSYLYSVRCVQD